MMYWLGLFLIFGIGYVLGSTQDIKTDNEDPAREQLIKNNIAQDTEIQSLKRVLDIQTGKNYDLMEELKRKGKESK